jgi:hypothetical protein
MRCCSDHAEQMLRIENQRKFQVGGKEVTDIFLSRNTHPSSAAGVPGISVPMGLNSDLNLTGVLFQKALVAVVAGELELLVLVELAGVEHECSDALRAVEDALHGRALTGDVGGELVEPPRIIGGVLATGIAASESRHVGLLPIRQRAGCYA